MNEKETTVQTAIGRYSNWLPYATAAPFLLFVVLLALSNPVDAARGSPPSATLSMLDDDGPPSAFFSSTTYVVHEGAGSATITVTLSAASGIIVTIDFATSDGTASAPDDYTPTNGTLTFSPGQTSQSFSVPIICDAVDELTETVNLTLSNPTNAIFGSPSSATLVISDSCGGPPSVSFSGATYFVDEGAGSATITVTLSAASGKIVTIDIDAAGGTASPGSDYTDIGGTLVFSPGQTTRPFSVPIYDDLKYEPTEIITLTLSNPSNAMLGAPSSAALYILDDDGPAAFVFIPFLFRNSGSSEPSDGCSDSYLHIRPNTEYWLLPNDPFAGYWFDTFGPANIVVEMTNFVFGEGMVLVYYSADGTCASFASVVGTFGTSTTKIVDLGWSPAGRYFLAVITDGPLSSTEYYRLIVHVDYQLVEDIVRSQNIIYY